MLIRICLIIAIVAGLAVGVLNFVTVKDKINTLQTDLANTKQSLTETRTKLASTERDLTQTKSDLAETKQTLETTKAQRDKAVNDAAAQLKRANQLADDLSKTKKDLGDAQAELESYKLTGLTPQQILSLNKRLKDAQDALAAVQEENRLLAQNVKELKNRLAIYEIAGYKVPLPAGLKGKILVSDPKWDFVVLNVGKDQGVLEYGELLVNRDGKLVAKVRVTSVQKDRCIANVMPGWKLGEVMEGDQVIPAYPAS